MKSILVCVFFVLSVPLQAEDTQSYKVSDYETYTYARPTGIPFVTNFFKDFGLFYTNYINTEHIPYMLGIGVSTAVTIHYDEDLLIGAQDLGRKWGVASQDHTKTYFKVFNFSVRFPSDLGSTLYFIGDGWTHTSIGAAFLGYGYFGNDYRAWSTAYGIFEGMLTTGATTQFIKHITGRESPAVRTRPRGRWDLFPDQVKYHKDVPAYDAFPSGHLATGTMTLTVIAENYPEYFWFIVPPGVTLLTLLSFQMMNNGVHWFSDYPLAIGLGYGFGQVAVSNYRKIERETQANKKRRNIEPIYTFRPVIAEHGYGVGMSVLF